MHRLHTSHNSSYLCAPRHRAQASRPFSFSGLARQRRWVAIENGPWHAPVPEARRLPQRFPRALQGMRLCAGPERLCCCPSRGASTLPLTLLTELFITVADADRAPPSGGEEVGAGGWSKSTDHRQKLRKICSTRVEVEAMKFRPLHDRVVVRRVEEETKTAGGIIIPDTAKEKPIQGEVLAVGPGARDEAGKLVPLDVKKGDRVLFGKWSGTEVKIDGQELLIMKESDILGIVEGKASVRAAA